jgi:lipopolysaccharide biosynthesis protein
MILILFVFHELNNRVYNFINNCIFYDENIHFIVISNNKNNVFSVPSNVKTIYRDNIGYDFGGWSEALLKNNLYKKYDKFIFVNSSVYGPFIQNKRNWVNIYINRLNHHNIKLFGNTINNLGDPKNKAHVQSYIFTMDNNTLQYLINCQIFSMTNIAKTFEEAIWNKEVLMSRKIIEKGWNIGSLQMVYTGVDFTFRYNNPKQYNRPFYDDIMFPEYRNKLWTEKRIIFIKGNRFGIH